MTHELFLAPAARADIVDALEWSVKNFGDTVRDGYEALIIAAINLIRDDPTVLGSRERDDLATGLRTLHLRACRDEVSPAVRRIASPRHFVVYRQVGKVIQVVRLLHEAMDIPAQRIPNSG
ncbi:type II toxin-antitoxin system RelE/ParE family toxin [Microbacterium sp. KRD172]|uniref:type II toxin-antitoxin system RelE/ParE family toxin n=1 Tax=Microbacterium sp. KRD172 TaxID=2729727 RepID=UPI0019D29CC2|nr:type II toxin-antitoxin system RelE/ParE family toxin [Microbacterium sp. KRD172]